MQRPTPRWPTVPPASSPLGHNGNLINAPQLRRELARYWDVEFQGSTDSEVIAHMFAKAPGATWEERTAYCMRQNGRRVLSRNAHP